MENGAATGFRGCCVARLVTRKATWLRKAAKARGYPCLFFMPVFGAILIRVFKGILRKTSRREVKILGEYINPRKNLVASFSAFRLLWLLLLASALMDFLSTVHFMGTKCICLEANVLVRFLAYQYGIVPGVLLGKLLQLISAGGLSSLSSRLSPLILLSLTAANLIAVAVNLLG